MHKIIRAKYEHLNEMVTVLNDTTKFLLSKGIPQWEYPFDKKTIEDEIIRNHAYVILEDDKVVAVFFIKTIEKDDHFPIVMKENHLYLYRIAVHPEHHGRGLGKQACGAAFSLAKELNKTVYLDCFEGNPKLRAFYTDVGFDYCGDFPEDDYWVSVYKFEPTINM